MAYKRNIRFKINDLLESFPAVAIIGARQTGKTTLVKSLRPNWRYVDLENSDDYQLISNDPRFFLENYNTDLIIDEAQTLPSLFNDLRGIVDSNRQQKGRFLITGSSSPELVKQLSESLAGRIAIVELGTLKVNELLGISLSPWYDLFLDTLSKDRLPSSSPPISRDSLHQAWLKGGYPEPNLNASIYDNWMQNYHNTYIKRDIASLFPKLNKQAYQRFLSILSRLSGTIINRSEMARNIEVSEKTIREYLSIASGTYMWRALPSYEKNVTKSIIKMPKGHIRDAGLLHYLLKIKDKEALYHSPSIGSSFEGFVIEEILKGLEASNITNWSAYYYRTRSGAEVDLILDGYFGLLPIEIKYGTKLERRQIKNLENFVSEHQAPFGLLINQSERPEWITKNVFQLPAGWL